VYNKIIQVGNLTRDIELRYSGSGTAIAKSAVAITRKFTSNGEKKEEVCFTDITFFGRSAEVANQYLRKGSKVLIEGRLQFDQWVDQNGDKRSKHSIAVESMQMLDSKSDSQSQGGQSKQQQDYRGHQGSNQANPTYSAPQQSQQMPQQQQPIDNDGLPF
jgi:single-strand DNA-binding protein